MSTASTAYDQAAGRVVDMMVSGLPFAQVEDAIDIAPVRPEEQAALWLLAWSIRPTARQDDPGVGSGTSHRPDQAPRRE